MDVYERAVVKLFEYCGFAYEPGQQPKPGEFYAMQLVETPYAQFLGKIVPGRWIRSVALHLHNTRHGCYEVSEYLGLIPRYLRLGGEAMTSDWLEEHLPVSVSDEVSTHVFCFLAFSEVIRDEIRSNRPDLSAFLVPARPVRRHRSRLPVKGLSQEIVSRGRISEPTAAWAAQQLSILDMHCRQTRAGVDEFASHSVGPAEVIVQAFSNLQAGMLELARVLIEADYAVDIWGECVS